MYQNKSMRGKIECIYGISALSFNSLDLLLFELMGDGCYQENFKCMKCYDRWTNLLGFDDDRE